MPRDMGGAEGCIPSCPAGTTSAASGRRLQQSTGNIRREGCLHLGAIALLAGRTRLCLRAKTNCSAQHHHLQMGPNKERAKWCLQSAIGALFFPRHEQGQTPTADQPHQPRGTPAHGQFPQAIIALWGHLNTGLQQQLSSPLQDGPWRY